MEFRAEGLPIGLSVFCISEFEGLGSDLRNCRVEAPGLRFEGLGIKPWPPLAHSAWPLPPSAPAGVKVWNFGV